MHFRSVPAASNSSLPVPATSTWTLAIAELYGLHHDACIIASCHLSSETAPLPCCPTASPMQVITMGNLAVDWLKLSPTSTCHHRGILKLKKASPICSLLSGSHQSGYSVWRNLSEGKRFTMKPIKIQCKA